MEHAQNLGDQTTLPSDLKPIPAAERIEAIDVVRGFALIGIFFMNIEWFNRSFNEFNIGIPPNVHGLDWAATYFVNFFVAGKFWTIFSLLFGMGFAVMLNRANATGRPFLVPYIRRVIGLGIFGILHTVLLWPGDILFSYAFTAAGLLFVLFGNWKSFLISAALMIALAFVPGMNSAWVLVGELAIMALLALFLRHERTFKVAGMQLSSVSIIFMVFGLIGLSAFAASFFVPPMADNRKEMVVMSLAFFATAFVATRYRDPVDSRFWKAGVWWYAVPFAIGVTMSALNYQQPIENAFNSPEAVKRSLEIEAKNKIEEEAKKAAEAAGKKYVAPEPKKDEKKVQKTEVEKKIEKQANTIVAVHEGEKRIAEDNRILSQGSYTDVVKHRWKEFVEAPFNAAGQAFVSIALFLMGVWFVRANVITRAKEHLPLFKKLAAWGLPLGLGVSVAASSIITTHTPGVSGDGNGLMHSLVSLASLPTCLAYVSIVVLMVHSSSVFANIKVLAPYGRMALTNYLMQSLIQASFFYGWGLGHYGMGRASQLAFAIGVICLQVVFSHIWLSYFRYGPMEWIWRGITYWKIPEFRKAESEVGSAVASASS
ncbi:DUF418 domain-containing protein [Undibacterium cyanobacteriorum]|uniref:DUF418 domain-containing protein n=1 Tax=Undibacterium cyanobacteriorum TaxID=3073561 RepID=A0ABY9RLF1_9BURK|nr:DUF418 domain-containing protein [Undibacterium sp. 20NA77.5]WMW82019.1 DUF418 domain-containing protein [Undibacterium sp. 20NA77.5]